MNANPAVRALFLLIALYEGALGAASLIAPEWVFRTAGVAPPNPWA
jgi:hypothetical protein